MAKSKNFFGLRSGSTKSLTFAVYNGQQITKDRVYDIANPQTEAQMKQRLLIPMVANMRSMLKGLLSQSFEGVATGTESLKKFSSLNLKKDALNVVSYVKKGTMSPGIADYIISDGSLESPWTYDEGLGTYQAADPDEQEDFDPTVDKTLYDDLNNANITQEGLENILGIKWGQQLTMIGMCYNPNSGDWKTPIPIISRLILTDDGLKEWTTTDYEKGEEFIITNGVSVINWNITEKSDIGCSVSFDQYSNNTLMNATMYGVMASSTDGKRSRCLLKTNIQSESVTYDEAVQTYLKSEASTDKYLNGGTEGAGLTGA